MVFRVRLSLMYSLATCLPCIYSPHYDRLERPNQLIGARELVLFLRRRTCVRGAQMTQAIFAGSQHIPWNESSFFVR